MRVAVLLVVLGWTATAHAQTYPPIEDREFALDLYSGAALGSVRIVGMGGAALGIAEGSAGALSNPAAAAVRLTTSKGSWDWDFHFDSLSAAWASDFDNNGDRGPGDFGTQMNTFGLAGMYRGWGLAVGGTTQSTRVDEQLSARALASKVSIGRELFHQVLTVGAAIRIGSFSLRSEEQQLFEISGAGLEVGGLWRPTRKDWRVGAAIAFPVTGTDVSVASCDPMDCDGYILPRKVAVPWQIAAGVAWRRAPTWWNQHISTHYRDEKALLIAADVVVSGAVEDGAGLEKFGAQELQRSGRRPVVSVRGGAEYELMPSRLRLRAGSYWEPSRFDGVAGRLHGTCGLEVSLFELPLFGFRFRGRIAFTADIAPRYGNAGISVGLWH